MFLYRKYIDEEELKGWTGYSYRVIDDNPTSKPIATLHSKMLDALCPVWAAPNLITLLGFACSAVHFLLPAWYDYDFSSSCAEEPRIPSHVWLATGLLLFSAHALDAVDGLQARRTGSGSPVGELLDHGVDTICVNFFIPCATFHIFGDDADGYGMSARTMYLLYWCLSVCWYVPHCVEKHCTEAFVFPWVYDVTMVALMSQFFAAAAFGTQAFRFRVLGLTAANLFTAATFVLSLISLKTGLVNIRSSCKVSFADAVQPLAPLLVMMSALWIWAVASPNGVLEADRQGFYALTGFTFSNVACQQLVSDVVKAKKKPVFNLALAVLLAGVCASLLTPGLSLSGELTALYSTTAVIALIQFHYATCVMIQLCDHLKINFLSIPGGGKKKIK